MIISRERLRLLLTASAVVIAPLFASVAHAWGPGGHRVTADVAYEQLSPTARTKCVEILRKHPEFKKRFDDRMPADVRKAGEEAENRWIFLQAAIWPDLIRPYPPYHHESWHYINIPLYLSPHDQAVLQGTVKPNISLVVPSPLTGGKDSLNCVQAFKLSVDQLEAADSTDEERAVALCWILHIGGDIHQPCHSTALMTRGRFYTAEGDRGGNKIKVKQSGNLHRLWDGLLGGEQPLNDIRGRTTAILADTELLKAGQDAATKIDIADWLNESQQLAKTFVYSDLILDTVRKGEADPSHNLPSIDIPESYLKDAGRHAQRRVCQAGFRLAKVLEKAID